MSDSSVAPLPLPVIDAAGAERLGAALRFAAEKQGAQRRKGTQINYVTHLLQVAALVLEHHGSIEQAIAALLHDVVEDADVAYAELERFGPHVPAIVRACTDTLADDARRDTGTWLARKTHYLAHLEELVAASDPAVLVTACDKRHNLGALVADVRRDGIAYLQPFNAGPDLQVWFYRSFATIVRPAVPPRLAAELHDLAETLAALCADASGADPSPR